MSTDQTTLQLEQKVKTFMKKALDINADDISPDKKLDQSLGIDSTEMVEISVGLKKEFGIALGDNELKKTQTFNEIIQILKAKGAN